MSVLTELLELLHLERIEQNLFRGQSQDLGWGRLYGGQVLGQALSAAAQTVDEGRVVHSMHGYFLRHDMADTPVVYTVDPIRDGRSFSTRRVVAVQNGKAIFNLAASFQVEEEGLDHAQAAPTGVTPPEELKSQRELALRIADKIPAPLREKVTGERPIEVRPVRPWNPLRPDERDPTNQVWFKATGPLPDDPAVHRYLLAYASDSHFLTTALFPHGVSWATPGIQLASLDHAMWFHRPFRLDEWLLYDVQSPSASSAKGLVSGHLYTRDGTLVASVVQEGLMRDWRKPAQ